MPDLTSLDRAHSRVSPSNFARVEACTASFALTPRAPRAAPGPDALLGTAAHALAEHCLKSGIDTIELGDMKELLVEGQMVPVDEHMLGNVQTYLDAARDMIYGRPHEVEATIRLGFAEMYLGEPIWGHADVLVREPPITIIDYKNGHHPVPADSAQLGLYLLMAALDADVDLAGDYDDTCGVTMIVQPNAEGPPIKRKFWSWAEVRELRDRVIATLRRIKRQDFTYADGGHCRFCPAIGVCPHLAAVAKDAAMTRIMPTPELVARGEVTAAALADWLDVAARLDVWIKQVNATALDYVAHGGALPGWKGVAKRTNRRWVDDAAAQAELEKLGADPWLRKLVTPAEAERRLPPDKRRGIEHLCERPAGGLTLAPADDPRRPLNISATLKNALEMSVAQGFLARSKQHELLGSAAKK